MYPNQCSHLHVATNGFELDYEARKTTNTKIHMYRKSLKYTPKQYQSPRKGKISVKNGIGMNGYTATLVPCNAFRWPIPQAPLVQSLTSLYFLCKEQPSTSHIGCVSFLVADEIPVSEVSGSRDGGTEKEMLI